jgi:hypothetical protein
LGHVLDLKLFQNGVLALHDHTCSMSYWSTSGILQWAHTSSLFTCETVASEGEMPSTVGEMFLLGSKLDKRHRVALSLGTFGMHAVFLVNGKEFDVPASESLLHQLHAARMIQSLQLSDSKVALAIVVENQLHSYEIIFSRTDAKPSLSITLQSSQSMPRESSTVAALTFLPAKKDSDHGEWQITSPSPSNTVAGSVATSYTRGGVRKSVQCQLVNGIAVSQSALTCHLFSPDSDTREITLTGRHAPLYKLHVVSSTGGQVQLWIVYADWVIEAYRLQEKEQQSASLSQLQWQRDTESLGCATTWEQAEIPTETRHHLQAAAQKDSVYWWASPLDLTAALTSRLLSLLPTALTTAAGSTGTIIHGTALPLQPDLFGLNQLRFIGSAVGTVTLVDSTGQIWWSRSLCTLQQCPTIVALHPLSYAAGHRVLVVRVAWQQENKNENENGEEELLQLRGLDFLTGALLPEWDIALPSPQSQLRLSGVMPLSADATAVLWIITVNGKGMPQLHIIPSPTEMNRSPLWESARHLLNEEPRRKFLLQSSDSVQLLQPWIGSHESASESASEGESNQLMWSLQPLWEMKAAQIVAVHSVQTPIFYRRMKQINEDLFAKKWVHQGLIVVVFRPTEAADPLHVSIFGTKLGRPVASFVLPRGLSEPVSLTAWESTIVMAATVQGQALPSSLLVWDCQSALQAPSLAVASNAFDLADAQTPFVLTSHFASPQPLAAIAVSASRLGIAYKQLLAILPTGQVYALDARLLDVRREKSQEPKAIGLVPWQEELILDPRMIISRNFTVGVPLMLASEAAMLESSSHGWALGTEGLFYTRLLPSKRFDQLAEDFDWPLLIGLILLVSVGSGLVRHLGSTRRARAYFA